MKLDSLYQIDVKSISVTDIGFVIFLSRKDSQKLLPIFVGPVEAQSISTVLSKQKSKRPLTHDLLRIFIEKTDYSLSNVIITHMKQETYFSMITFQKKKFLKRKSDKIEVDCRPSDGIAMALRFKVPIYINKELFEKMSIHFETKEDQSKDESIIKNESFAGISKKMNDELGSYQKKLEKAIKEDRFEDANEIKNKINLLIKEQNN